MGTASPVQFRVTMGGLLEVGEKVNGWYKSGVSSLRENLIAKSVLECFASKDTERANRGRARCNSWLTSSSSSSPPCSLQG